MNLGVLPILASMMICIHILFCIVSSIRMFLSPCLVCRSLGIGVMSPVVSTIPSRKSSVSASEFHCFIFFFFLRPHLQHLQVPGLGLISELQLPAYTTATAKPDLSLICDLCFSLWQHRSLNPLSKARN